MLWHYTIKERLTNILADGLLKLANERRGAAVWFSTNELWEPTASKIYGLPDGSRRGGDLAFNHRWSDGVVRIGVAAETAPYDWHDYQRLSGLDRKMLNGLRKIAIRLRSRPSEWFVSFEPVPRDKWLAIHAWDGTHWNDSKDG